MSQITQDEENSFGVLMYLGTATKTDYGPEIRNFMRGLKKHSHRKRLIRLIIFFLSHMPLPVSIYDEKTSKFVEKDGWLWYPTANKDGMRIRLRRQYFGTRWRGFGYFRADDDMSVFDHGKRKIRVGAFGWILFIIWRWPEWLINLRIGEP